MGITVFGTGPVLSETDAATTGETGCNITTRGMFTPSIYVHEKLLTGSDFF